MALPAVWLDMSMGRDGRRLKSFRGIGLPPPLVTLGLGRRIPPLSTLLWAHSSFLEQRGMFIQLTQFLGKRLEEETAAWHSSSLSSEVVMYLCNMCSVGRDREGWPARQGTDLGNEVFECTGGYYPITLHLQQYPSELSLPNPNQNNLFHLSGWLTPKGSIFQWVYSSSDSTCGACSADLHQSIY